MAFVDAFYRLVQDTELLAAAANDLRRPVMALSIRKWNRLTVADIVQASEDEACGKGHSNIQFSEIVSHAIGLLKKRQGNIFSGSRLKEMMWGRVIVWSLPSVMLGIKIEGGNKHVLEAVIGADAAREWQKKNAHGTLANSTGCNPFWVARMLSACAQGTLNDLLGLKSTREGVQTRQTGVLGKVRGYLASVAPGGAGSVTLNVVVWLMDAPSVPQMRAALRSREFREKVRRYIDAVVRGEPSDDGQGLALEREKMDNLQRHTCSARCPKHSCAHGRIPQSATSVCENGTWQLARGDSTYDSYCPSFCRVLGVSQRVHFFTNGPATLHNIDLLARYLTAPAVTKLEISSTISAVLGDMCQTAWMPGWMDQYSHSTQLLGAVMIAITHQNETQTEMKAITLMGSDDYRSSHPAKVINWHMLYRALLANYKELRR